MAASFKHLVRWFSILVVLSQLSVGKGQLQGCFLRFDIQSNSSVLTLNGQSIKPLPVPIRATSNLQLAGSLYLKLSGTAACPTQLTLSSFSGATFIGPQTLNLSASYPPSLISMSPPVLYTRAGAGGIIFANVTFYDLEVAVGSSELAPDAQTGAFSVPQNWTVVSGMSEEKSILGPAFTFFDLSNTPSTVTSAGAFSVSGQVATLSFPTFEWPLMLLGGAKNQQASYTFQGSVVATAVLGCPASCSFRGRCELQGSTPTCACDCGFAGADCSQTFLAPLSLESATSAYPSTATGVTNDGNVHLQLVGPNLGDLAALSSSNLSAFVGNASCGPLTRVSSSVATCALPPQPDALNNRAPVRIVRGCQRTFRTLTSLVSVNPPSASAQIPPPSPSPGSSPGTCPVDLDKQCAGVPATATATGACTCDCLAGWTGVDCSVCTADDVCQALNLGARCDTGPLYGANTTYKAYGCKLTSSSLAAYIQSDMAIRCDVSKRACTILLDVLSDGQTAPVNCTATGCAFRDGQGAFTCAELSCGCGGQKVPCPTDLSQTINTLTGSSKMACADDGSGKCTLSLDALPSDLEATCSIGECTNSGNVTFQASPGRHVDTTAIGVAVPVSVLGSAALLALAWYARKRQRVRGEAEYVTWAAENEKFLEGNKTGSGRGGAENGRVSSGEGSGIDSDRGGMSGGIVDVGARRLAGGNEAGVNDVVGLNGARNEGSGKSPGRTLEVRKLSVLLSPGKWWRSRSVNEASRTHIVSDVSFTARPGEVLGVFGPSGGGKTTLLSVVAGVGGDRLGRVSVTGTVLLDGKERNDDYRLLTSLLPQDDLLYGTLTAQESIAYSAELRLPAFMPTELKRKRVESTVALLGLSPVQHSRIGSLLGGRGLSGGERRRVRIGMELVTDCDVLLMDEPTSGLDSHRALKLLQQLHAIARTGKTVILSVHQPSQEAFEQLDQILLLSASGHQMYCGPRDGLPRYFEAIGRPCPPNRTFPDHMLSIVSADDVSENPAKPLSETSSASLNEDPLAACAYGETSESAQADPENPAPNPGRLAPSPNGFTHHTKDKIGAVSQPHAAESSRASKPQAAQSTPKRKRRDPNLRRSFVTQLLVLYKRELLNVFRNPGLLLTHVVVSVILGLLVGGVYYQVSGNLAGFQNRAGAFYFTIVFLALSSTSALEAFISERAIFVSEGAGRFYSPLAFFVPKVSLDWLLLRILPSLIYGTILYFMMGLRTDGGRFGVFLAVLFLVSVTSSSLCVLVSLAVPSVAIANVVALVAILVFLCFGGFLVNGESIPPALRWLPKISFVTYAFEALMINELHGLTFSFRTVGIGPVLSLKGDSFLDQLGLSRNTLGRDLGILAAMAGIYICAACVLLHLRVRAGRMMRMRP